MLRKETVSNSTRELLKNVDTTSKVDRFFLVGGTALEFFNKSLFRTKYLTLTKVALTVSEPCNGKTMMNFS
jgi:hypothetical protein